MQWDNLTNLLLVVDHQPFRILLLRVVSPQWRLAAIIWYFPLFRAGLNNVAASLILNHFFWFPSQDIFFRTTPRFPSILSGGAECYSGRMADYFFELYPSWWFPRGKIIAVGPLVLLRGMKEGNKRVKQEKGDRISHLLFVGIIGEYLLATLL